VFAAIAWGLSTVAFVIAGVCLSYATVVEVDRLTRISTPTPPEVASDVIVRSARDDQGRRASFRVLLFTDEFRWRMSSYESLESRAEQPTFTPEMKAVLDRAREIIVVGASSEEIVPGLSLEAGRRREEDRAGRRAGRIAWWVRQALSSPVPVRKLNVGHHMPTGSGDTSDQRRVVIILVLEREDGTNVDQALRAAMALESINAPIFEALLTRYSLAAGKAFTWVE
jgi:hypothetical protein